VIMGASSPVTFDRIGFEAFDFESKRSLRSEPVADTDPYLKVVRIYLDKPIQQEEEFGITWNFVWPNCLSGKLGLDYVNLDPFVHGVDRIIHEVKLLFPVSPDSRIYVAKDGELVMSGQLHNVEEEHGKSHMSYVIDRPSSADRAYILTWLRRDKLDTLALVQDEN